MMSSAPAPRHLPCARRPWRWLAVAAVAWLVAGCGGSQVQEFDAARLVVFGDEMSTIEGDGRKYTVNGLNTAVPPALDCRVNPVWVQSVANGTGLVFAECNPDAKPVTAFVQAAAGARTADVTAALAAHAGASRDLLTVAVGLHDVLDAYGLYTGSNLADLETSLEASGKALAEAVNAVVRLGGPVALVSTVPDVGVTPWALAAETAQPGSKAVLTQLTEAFNRGLRQNIVNDGRRIGLVDGFDQVRAMVTSPGSYGLTNVVAPSCANAAAYPATSPAALLDCTTATLATGASATQWLWADRLRLGPTGHARLANVANSRLRSNPF